MKSPRKMMLAVLAVVAMLGQARVMAAGTLDGHFLNCTANPQTVVVTIGSTSSTHSLAGAPGGQCEALNTPLSYDSLPAVITAVFTDAVTGSQAECSLRLKATAHWVNIYRNSATNGKCQMTQIFN